MPPSEPDHLLPTTAPLHRDDGLAREIEEALLPWPSSSPPSAANRALASRLCRPLNPAGTDATTTSHSHTGWSAQDCITLAYPHGSYMVKLPRLHGAHAAAACHAEAVRAQWAAARRLGPEVVATDGGSGAFAMVFIEGQLLATPELVSPHEAQLFSLLRGFHASEPSDWMVSHDPWAVVRQTLDAAKRSKSMAAEDLQLIADLLSWTKAEVGDTSHLHVPCHNDFHGRNIVLDEDGKLWAVDYEEMNLGDPMWDLAYFTATLEVDRFEFAEAYRCTPEERRRLGHYYLLAVAYCAAWRAIHGPSWVEQHRDCMARLRRIWRSEGATLERGELSAPASEA